MKFSKTFETPFFGLEKCLAVSMTFLHSDNTTFWKNVYVSCFLQVPFSWEPVYGSADQQVELLSLSSQN